MIDGLMINISDGQTVGQKHLLGIAVVEKMNDACFIRKRLNLSIVILVERKYEKHKPKLEIKYSRTNEKIKLKTIVNLHVRLPNIWPNIDLQL